MSDDALDQVIAEEQEQADANDAILQELQAEPLSFWLTSRSAHESGSSRCPMLRYLGYHAGPFGYGWQPRAQSIPLATGTYTDHGISLVLQWLIDQGNNPDVTQFSEAVSDAAPPQLYLTTTAEYQQTIRWAARHALDAYQAVIRKRGFLNAETEQDQAAQYALMFEQMSLIEGLTWVYCLYQIPQLLSEGRIIGVQSEEVFVSDCDCGIGDFLAMPADHAGRGCTGHAILAKPDFLRERFSDSGLEYHELKTASMARKDWQESWETKAQFILSILGVERRLEREVTSTYVHGLLKGKRDRERQEDGTYGGPKKQQSFLCYAFYKDGNPPMDPPEWREQYNYVDELGKNRRVTKEYRKLPLWPIIGYTLAPKGITEDFHEWWYGPDRRFEGKPEGWSNIEYWVKALDPELLAKTYRQVGPMPKRRDMIEMGLDSFHAEEALWKWRLSEIWNYVQQTGATWADEHFQRFISRLIPRSFDCDRYAAHPCGMKRLCFKGEGWQDPVGSGAYVYRVPHHAMEKAQVIARGLVPEGSEGWALEEDEQEEGDW